MAELNLVEKANKVISFRKVIRDICRKKGLEYPSDDKISEYINQKYGMNVDDFMKDYTEKEGIFREPLKDFMKQINEVHWSVQPTEEEVKEFVARKGYDYDEFWRERVLKHLNPLEREVYLNTIKELNNEQMVILWNLFIEESAMYGEDSYIYDLTNEHDVKVLRGSMTPSEWAKVKALGSRFIQWFDLNDGEIKIKKEDEIKDILLAFWSEIFDRIMLFPSCYKCLTDKNGDALFYLDYVVFDVLRKHLGYEVDKSYTEIKYVGAK